MANSTKLTKVFAVGAMVLTGAVAVIGTDVAQAGAAASPISANLLTASQSGFAAGTGGWTAANATLTHGSSADGEPGSIDAVTTSSSTASVTSAAAGSASMTAAQPGLVYGATIAMHSPSSTAAQVRVVVAFYSSTGSLLGATAGATTAAPTSGWTNASGVVGIAPANTSGVSLQVQITNEASGIAVDFTDASITDSSQQAPAVDGPLTVSGNQVLDADGNPVHFKGVDLYGLENQAQAFQGNFVSSIRQWGVNFVRLSLGEQFWDSNSCNYSSKYASIVNQTVNALTAQGIYVMLDLHLTNALDLNNSASCPAGIAQDMADSGSVTFWQQVAAQYANNPLVGFDLYNEPHNLTDAQWLNGGNVQQSSTETFTAIGMQQLYNTVRATGANNLIFIEGNNWSTAVPSVLVSGTNIVYSPHYYTCEATSCAATASTDPSTGLNAWVNLSASYPIFDGEFGWASPFSGTYIANTIEYIESHNWLGYDAFAYTPQGNITWALVGSASSDGRTEEPAADGQAVVADTAGYPTSFTGGTLSSSSSSSASNSANTANTTSQTSTTKSASKTSATSNTNLSNVLASLAVANNI